MNKTLTKSTLLTLLAFSFVALFAVGCGDSRENFVNTTNNNNANGNLVFQFQQAAAPRTTVPAGTATLRFDFFSTDPGTEQTLLFTETRPFATEVRFDNVSSQVASVAVTAFGADGLPTQTNVASVAVVIGNDVVVDLNAGTVATFDALTGPGTINLVSDNQNILRRNQGTLNQLSGQETVQLVLTGTFTPGGDFGLPINDQVAAFSFANSGVANISATGLITGVNFGANTTLTADYTALSTLRSTDVTIQTFFFAILDSSEVIPTNLTDVDIFGIVRFINKRGVRTNVVNSEATTYALGTPVLDGVSINANTGNITTGSTTGTQNIIVTYVDPDSGLTFTDTHTVTVSNIAN